MDPSTLPEDIYRLLDDETDHTPSEDNVEWAGEALKDLLRRRLLRRPSAREGESVLRFSSLGKHPRQLWYAQNMPEVAEKMHGQTNLKFIFGDLIELLILFLAKEAGHEVTHEQYEVNVDGVKGHTDAVIDGVPIDVKSASPFAFDKFRNGSFVFDDPFGYVAQLSGYAHALGKTERAAILAVQKVSGEICIAPLDQDTILCNKPEDRIPILREALSKKTPPPRCYELQPEGQSGNMKLPIGCSYCAFKQECYKDANKGRGLRGFLYSKGPVWLAEVHREPNVPEIT